MVVRLDKDAMQRATNGAAAADADSDRATAKTTEVDKMVAETKQKIADGSTAPIGVSATNSGHGYDDAAAEEEFVPTTLDQSVVEEEVAVVDDDEDAEVARAGEDTPVQEKPAKGGTVL